MKSFGLRRSGTVDLPLHGGRVPQWLSDRMTALGTAVTEAIIREYGTSGFLTRLSDPFWFQAFGCVMGMDWHSSGITTSVMAALKRGLAPRARELGIYVCGGRGRFARNTPAELRRIADHRGFDGEALVRTSRLTAHIDNNAIGDGFQIYLHSFVLTSDREWVVVQQGLNPNERMARRYHWHSRSVCDFVAEPHTAIVGAHQGKIMNLVDLKARAAQTALMEIVRERPERTLLAARHLRMPTHHDVRAEDVNLKRLGSVLALAYDRDLHNFAELLLLEKLGPRTLQSLALIAEVIHGAPTRFSDPARFSFAHGGKDGHPFPVPLKTYDQSLAVLRNALQRSKLGHTEKLSAFRRLDRYARAIEKNLEPKANFGKLVEYEKLISPFLDGRSV
jgi:uncharacterized protein